jgi:hypothetical protein
MQAKITEPVANRTAAARAINSRFCSCASVSAPASAGSVASAVGISIDKESPSFSDRHSPGVTFPAVQQNTRITWDYGDNSAQPAANGPRQWLASVGRRSAWIRDPAEALSSYPSTGTREDRTTRGRRYRSDAGRRRAARTAGQYQSVRACASRPDRPRPESRPT